MQINIQNNQENSYEKFKKFLNNPITKFSLGTVGGIAALSLIAKLIYDKIHQNKHQNKIYKELIINDVILSIADQIWIDKNMILFAQKDRLCWHNVFMQLLACPEYIYYSNDPSHPIHKSKKIMTMINFAKLELKKPTEHFLKRKVTVPMEVRQMPDDVIFKIDPNSGKFVPEDIDSLYNDHDWLRNYQDWPNMKFHERDWLHNMIFWTNFSTHYIRKNNEGKYISNYMSNELHLANKLGSSLVFHAHDIKNKEFRFDGIEFNKLGILDIPVTEICIHKPKLGTFKKEVYGWNDDCKKDDAMKFYTEKAENIYNQCNTMTHFDVNELRKYGYYPTFFIVMDNVDYSIPHYHCCYIVYDKDKNIKYFLWGDGCENGFKIMSEQKSLERLNKYSNIDVKFSRSDIVEKFYTPELMKNAD